MQFVRHFDHDRTTPVGWGIRVLLLAEAGTQTAGDLAGRLARLGGWVDEVSGAGEALTRIGADVAAFDLVVIDADAFGGTGPARALLAGLHRAGQTIPSIIVSSDCRVQVFPAQIGAPVELRAPLSAVSLRVGFEHAMRHRLLVQVA